MSRFIELYRRHGFSLVALRPKTKTPLGNWREFQERKATPEEIDTWFGQHGGVTPNVGIVTGAISN